MVKEKFSYIKILGNLINYKRWKHVRNGEKEQKILVALITTKWTLINKWEVLEISEDKHNENRYK